MSRILYGGLLYLGLPFLFLRLLWRSRRQPAYLRRLGERWGFYGGEAAPEPVIWLHAVSVGETRAAQPLVEGLQALYPDSPILLTAMTPTGREAGRALYGDKVLQAYLPYDYPGAVQRFLRHFRPRLGVLMETEIWPNLLAAARRHGVPVTLANARLSARSAAGYTRFAALARPAFAALSACAAQTAQDAERLAALGAPDPVVCGNLKFDVRPDPALLALGRQWREETRQRAAGRFIWLAASTREGEEALVLEALARLPENRVLLVLAPRHPQRFDAAAALAAAGGWRGGRRSRGLPGAEDQVWLGDSMGEMAAYYAMADAAFIGGSLLPLGGQNLIEAAACGCPALIGPHTFNFAQASEDAIAAGAARRVADVPALAAALEELLAAPEKLAAMSGKALDFASRHRGAAQRVLEVIRRPGDSTRR